MSDGSANVWDVEVAALDLETTGLDPRVDRVVEVAVVRGRLGGPVTEWSTLVDPERPMGAEWVHGIGEEMVRGQPTFRALLDEVEARMAGAVFLAHNAPFDLGFLRAEAERCARGFGRVLVLDTLQVARRNYRLPSNALEALCQRFGVRRSRAHRALDDARATHLLAGTFFDELDPGRTLSVDGARALRRPDDHVRAVYASLAEAGDRPVEILYDAHAERSRRRIRVLRLDGGRVRAWCFLRDAEREFALERIRWVRPVDA